MTGVAMSATEGLSWDIKGGQVNKVLNEKLEGCDIRMAIDQLLDRYTAYYQTKIGNLESKVEELEARIEELESDPRDTGP